MLAFWALSIVEQFRTTGQIRSVWEAGAQLVSVLFLSNLFGIPFGIAFGLRLGVEIGLEGGIILGILTRFLFFPLKDPRHYRRVVALVSGVVGTLAIPAMIDLKFGELVGSAWVKSERFYYVIVPSVLAIIAVIVFSQRLARWYERESTKGTAQNVTAN